MRGTIHLVTADDCLALRPLSNRSSTASWRATPSTRRPCAAST